MTMLFLTRRRTGSLADLRLGQTAAKALLAGGVMTGLAALTMLTLTRFVSLGGLVGGLLVVVIPGGIGVLAYLAFASLLGIDEIGYLRGLLHERLLGKP
jgi:hypothetical protein